MNSYHNHTQRYRVAYVRRQQQGPDFRLMFWCGIYIEHKRLGLLDLVGRPTIISNEKKEKTLHPLILLFPFQIIKRFRFCFDTWLFLYIQAYYISTKCIEKTIYLEK